jgi:hydroxymethylpyrimidine/phosphomethylpyrimidine kinase
MLYSSTAIEVVFDILQKYNVGKIILDPMISSSSGALLLQESSLKFLLDKANFCSVITPNTIEINLIAKSLGISKSKNIELANQVAKKLNTNIIVTGGHIEDLQKSKNILIDANGNNIKEVEFTKINTQHTHGSGCVFSSALAFFYAETENLEEALARATLFTTKAVEQGKNNVFSNDKKSYCSVQPVCSKCNSW